MPQSRDNPYLNFRFRVQIDNAHSAGFSEIEGLEGRIAAVAYRDGADTESVARLLPGRVEYSNVVLRRGFAGDTELFEWWQSVAQGNLDPRNVAIILQDEQGKDVARWLLRRAWPTKYVGPDLRALGNEVAIETLELAHEGIELA